MTPHVVSVALLLGFVLGMVGLVGLLQRTGRTPLPVTALWGLLASGYLLTGARFVQTMDAVDWADGLVGFAAICGALPVAHLIRRVCPACRRRLRLLEAVVTRPNRHRAGVSTTTRSCPHCGYHQVHSHAIPRLAETSAEAVPWSPVTDAPGCFGGSYAAGDGGGAGWASTPDAHPTPPSAREDLA
jgi:hypothetical protein